MLRSLLWFLLRPVCAVWFWLCLVLSVFIFSSLQISAFFVLKIFFSRHSFFVRIHAFSIAWARSLFFVCPWWKVVVTGKHHVLDLKRPVVFVANHTSLIDIFLVLILGFHFRWLAKRELFLIPFLGWSMSFASYISVDRKKREGRAKALDMCKRSLEEGISVVLFPEGTRNRGGGLLPFRAGAFRLAERCGCVCDSYQFEFTLVDASGLMDATKVLCACADPSTRVSR